MIINKILNKNLIAVVTKLKIKNLLRWGLKKKFSILMYNIYRVICVIKLLI